MLGLAVGLVVAVGPSHAQAPDGVDDLVVRAPAEGVIEAATDPASSPADPSILGGDTSDVGSFFRSGDPRAKLPAGVLRHTPWTGPELLHFFSPDAEPEWEFVPAPAPDLFVGEPDYGSVDTGLVHAAATVLGRPVPLQLDEQAAEALVNEAADAAGALLAVTEASFTVDGLLAASATLGQPVGSLFDLDPAVLTSLAAERLTELFEAWGTAPRELARPDQLVAALGETMTLAGVPATVNVDGLRRLTTATRLLQAPGRWSAQGGALGLTRQPDPAEGVRHEQVEVALPAGGMARGHLIVWDPTYDATGLIARFAGPWGLHASTVQAAAATGAPVVVNGAFWIEPGDPDGLLVTDGWVLSDTTAWDGGLRGLRGAFGVSPDREVLVGRPDLQMWLDGPGEGTVAVTAVNRPVRRGQTIAFTDRGAAPSVAPGVDPATVTWVRLPAPGAAGDSHLLDGPAAPGAGWVTIGTTQLSDEIWSVPGAWTSRWAGTPGWTDLDTGLAGGPLLLAGGVPTDVSEWRAEGFDSKHTNKRHPRTALGVNDVGAVYLLVMDGRQPEWSSGLTAAETSALLAAMGATDAVMLDGGGSSQLVVGGTLRNRPCCDTSLRAVESVITLGPR